MKNHFFTFCVILAVLFAFSSCSGEEPPIDHNDLSVPVVMVPTVLESSATIVWDAVPNATAYVYSFNGGAEQTTDRTSLTFMGLTPKQTYTFKVKAQKPNSLYFRESGFAEVSFTTTAHVAVYQVSTFGDDWDTWHYEWNDNNMVKRVYRLTGENTIEREWIFAYSNDKDTIVTVTGHDSYTMTLDGSGHAKTLKDVWDSYEYAYDDDGYMIKVMRNGEVISNIEIEGGNIVSWSKFEDGVEKFKAIIYGDRPNVAGSHCIYSERCGAPRWLVETGMFGKASKNSHITSQWDYVETATPYSFDLDDNGCISVEHKDPEGWAENFHYTYIKR